MFCSEGSSCILHTSLLSGMWLQIFSPICSLSFQPLHIGFCKAKVFNCDDIQFIIFSFCKLKHLSKRNENIYLHENLCTHFHKRFIVFAFFLVLRKIRNQNRFNVFFPPRTEVHKQSHPVLVLLFISINKLNSSWGEKTSCPSCGIQ